jgi:hypothetical protein
MKMAKKGFRNLSDFSDRCSQAATLTNARRLMDDLSDRISSLDPFSQEKVPYFTGCPESPQHLIL